MIEAGRNVPVDIPDIIAIHVFTHFTESHSPAFKGAMVFSRKNVL
jgi:hypothetical protein